MNAGRFRLLQEIACDPSASPFLHKAIVELLDEHRQFAATLALTENVLRMFQDRFDALGDTEYGTLAYGHRQRIATVNAEGQ